MSINEDDLNSNISKNNSADYVASIAKSTLGAVPFAGSLLVEIAGNIIPNQRIDRIAKYAEALNSKLFALEEAIVLTSISNENFTDLIEESMRQAVKTLTDERRNYVASLVVNSISSEDVEFFESKHLLSILGQINDVEIIWLRFYLNPEMSGDNDFRNKHPEVLKPISPSFGSGQALLDKSTLQNSYKEHLTSLGLLEKEFDMNTSGRGVELKTKRFKIAPLGRFLLREIGFSDARLV